MQSLNAEVGSNGVPVVAAASADKLDETLVAQAIQCLDMETLRADTPHVRSYQASVPAALDPKTSDALDRLGVVLASTQLRIVGQTCTPKQVHVARLSPNSMWLDFSVQDTVKTNGHFVVANLGPGAQVNCEWFYPDPPNVFSGRPERIDIGKFRAIRCTAPSQLCMRMNVAFATPSIDDDDTRRRAVANKYTLVMLVFCHDKNPKPTPIATASTSVSTKRKITAAPPPPATEDKVNATRDDSDHSDDNDNEEESKPNGHAKEELWTSSESVKLAVTKQRDQLRAATGSDLNALKALAVERGKSVEDIITAVSWWVLGRASSLSRSLGSFFLSKPYDWFDVVYARLPLESRRPTPAFTAANEAILQPYVFNILTVLINNVGLVPQWTVHHAKLLDKYRAQLKKFKVLEIMGSEPFIDALSNECTVFTFQKAFSFLFCVRMLRYLTPDQLLRMSPAGVVDPIKPKLDEYLRCKTGNKQKPPVDADTKQVKRKVEDDAKDKATMEKEEDESKEIAEDKKPKKKPRRKSPSSSSSSESSAESSEDDEDANAEQATTKKKKKKTSTPTKKEKKTTTTTPKKKKKKKKSSKDNDDDEPVIEKKAKKSGGKEKALLAVSTTASKAPVETKRNNDDNDDDDDGITVSMVMPTAMLQASIQQRNQEEYVQLMKVTRDLVKSGDEKQIGEYDWVAAADQMQRVRPLFDKLVPAPTNRTATTASVIDLGSKPVLKLRPVGLLKTSLLHILNMNVQSFLSKLINAECAWDVLKVSDNRLPPFETRTSCAYQFASTSRPSDTKDQVYVVELQFHPGVHRVSSVGVFKEPSITGPKINRLLDSSLFAEIWYIGPLPELERLKSNLDRIPDVVSVIE